MNATLKLLNPIRQRLPTARYFHICSKSTRSPVNCDKILLFQRQFVNPNCQRNFFVVPVYLGDVSPTRTVPDHIKKPPYALNPFHKTLYKLKGLPGPDIKNEKQISGMRDAGSSAWAILKYAGMLVRPGVTTDEIDAKVHEMIIKQSAYPSPLLYKGFPKSICTSVNEVACHGIPDDRELQEGDIINIDITVYYNGFHGDCSDTFLVGQCNSEAELLVSIAREARDNAMRQCGPGVPLAQIGEAVSKVAEEMNFNIVHEMIGHGIGEYFHGLPNIYHYRNEDPGIMKEGMTFTIEPILSEGSGEVRLLKDGWTLVTADKSRTAQSEHTVLITANGVEILTDCE